MVTSEFSCSPQYGGLISGMQTETVTNLRRHTVKIISDAESKKVPILVTLHGRATAFLIDVQTYEFQQNKLAILEGIRVEKRPSPKVKSIRM